ncbi:PiggyBac transposable element-derived protein 4 [Eumeta japonica]|uniref:PiggyBac transposable element-derived protein 4 n=1 Tax=Eumeta variegata TaxID=151549 RepID=A0A4C1VAB4_EUMVA|nr:PiggyBac transposable element-derived protein 4 [Eumeta japonica]
MKSWTFFWKIFLLMARVCVVWRQMKNRMMVLGDTPPQLQPDIDDVFTSEDDVPLSNLASSSVGTPTFVEPNGRKTTEWKSRWKDKRSVFILTNYIDPTKSGVVTRRERNGDKTEVNCPEAVMVCNSCMNYVDKFDQLKSTYAIDRKSHKWWHRIFFHFLDCAVINSFLVYKELQKNHHPELDKMESKDFRRSVYQGILAPAKARQGKRPSSRHSLNSSGASSPLPVLIKRNKPSVPIELRTESNMHQPERTTSLRCAKCSTKNNPARTVWQCSTCKVPLCIRKDKTCFLDFDKK